METGDIVRQTPRIIVVDPPMIRDADTNCMDFMPICRLFWRNGIVLQRTKANAV